MRTHRIALLITVISASPAIAQVLRGRVQDAATGRPLPGVFVTISDANGRTRLGALTDSLGRFFLHPSEAGAYSLRAELIGYESVTRSDVRVSAGVATDLNLAMPVNAIRLQEIAVTRDRTCTRDPREARETAAVWEEARKALSLAVWLDRETDARFRIRIVEEKFDLRRRRTAYPVWEFDSIDGRQTFQASPADSLLDSGFVQISEAGPVDYYGPDAQLLVSPRFVAEHCFSIERRRDRKGLVGLAFEPMSNTRVSGIRGALWLNEASGALEFIDYEYVHMPMRVDREYAGGHVSVRQLPNGAFIVDSYRITMPLLQQNSRGGAIRTYGLHERIGEVLDISVGGKMIALVPRYTVRGTAYDSLLGRPLANARIAARGTPFRAVTDTLGAFVLHGVPDGLYVVDFEDPAVLSRPGLRTFTFEVDSSNTEVAFGLPSRKALLAGLCPRDRSLRSAARRLMAGPDQLGVLQLNLLNPDGTRWSGTGYVFEVVFMNRPAEGDHLASVVRRKYDPDERGFVTACGVPTGEPLQVLIRGGAGTKVLTLAIPPDGFLRTAVVLN